MLPNDTLRGKHKFNSAQEMHESAYKPNNGSKDRRPMKKHNLYSCIGHIPSEHRQAETNSHAYL